MAYATEDDLQGYLGAGAGLPTNAARLLDLASELLDEATLMRYDTTDTDHVTAMKKAACAQVEYWIEVGEARDVTGPVQGEIVGSVQIQYGAGSNRIAPKYLGPRAKRHLLTAGLLYRGV
jgi:hypothetical protein